MQGIIRSPDFRVPRIFFQQIKLLLGISAEKSVMIAIVRLKGQLHFIQLFDHVSQFLMNPFMAGRRIA